MVCKEGQLKSGEVQAIKEGIREEDRGNSFPLSFNAELRMELGVVFGDRKVFKVKAILQSFIRISQELV